MQLFVGYFIRMKRMLQILEIDFKERNLMHESSQCHGAAATATQKETKKYDLTQLVAVKIQYKVERRLFAFCVVFATMRRHVIRVLHCLLIV